MTKLLFFALFLSVSAASRILFVFPIPSKSHMVIVHALSTALAERGHEVTVVSLFPLDKKLKNHRDIKLSLEGESANFVNTMAKEAKNGNFVSMFLKAITFGIQNGIDAVESDEFKKLLDEDFDLLVIGMTFNNFLLGYGEHFNCPTAMLSVQKHMTVTSEVVGNPIEAHSVPHIFLGSTEETFSWRVKNFLATSADYLVSLYSNYCQKQAYNKLFPSTKYRSYEESLANVSLTLVNDHFATGSPRPLVPASIEVRGIQINHKSNPLPKDIENFLEIADHGVIFFSLGSNVKSDFISEEKFQIILSTFAKLKQKIIMKWDDDEIENKPENVLIGKWLPQGDILAHPKTKLFISHCGLGSLVESRYHGVPVLGIPIFGDQPKNAKDVVEEGRAIKLDLQTLNEENFYDTIIEILENKTFSSRAKKLSELDRDRPLNAKETAIYWLEYVMRHHGAPHMQYKGINRNFWQRNSLDVIGFLIIFFYVLIKALKILLRLIYKILCSNNKKKKE